MTGSLHNPATNHVCQEEGVGHYKFYCFPGEGHIFNKKNIKGGLGDFTFMLIGTLPAPFLKVNAPLQTFNILFLCPYLSAPIIKFIVDSFVRSL